MLSLVARITLLFGLLLTSIYGMSAEDRHQVIVSAPFIDLHTGPGRGYPKFYVAERGQSIWLLKRRTDWVKVELENGKTGWVSVKQLSFTNTPDGTAVQLPYPDFASYQQRQWEIGFMVGELQGSDELTAYAGYHFTENLSMELTYSENFGNFSDGESITVNIVHQAFPQWRYSPFISIGGGYRKTNPSSTLVDTEDRRDDLFTVGAGLRIYLTNRFILRLQYKNNTVLTNRDDDEEVEEWKIGLSTFF